MLRVKPILRAKLGLKRYERIKQRKNIKYGKPFVRTVLRAVSGEIPFKYVNHDDRYLLVSEKGIKRDGKDIVLKNGGWHGKDIELRDAQNFSRFLKEKAKELNFEVVGIKSLVVSSPTKVIYVAQKYYRRPSLGSLIYLLKRKKLLSQVQDLFTGQIGVEKEALANPSIAYSADFVRKNPSVTLESVRELKKSIEKQFNDFHAIHIIGVKSYIYRFSSNNILIFGVDKKTGRFKIGIVDL
ncbi:MAG: hypothetical protein NTY48_06855 [Candidatus Diapherotrites archaeon]|nr:hypothetical protein [Candidatus Diapherotrites archaeon]